MDKQNLSARACTPEELEAFNVDLKTACEKHGVRLVPNPLIKEGKIECELIALKLIELVPKDGAVLSPLNGEINPPTEGSVA